MDLMTTTLLRHLPAHCLGPEEEAIEERQEEAEEKEREDHLASDTEEEEVFKLCEV